MSIETTEAPITFRQMEKQHPQFTLNTLYYRAYRLDETPHLKPAFVRLGKRWYVYPNLFFKLLQVGGVA